MSLKVIDGIMGIKESEWKLPAVDYRLLESKRGVMSMRGIRGLSDQELNIITPDLWEGKEDNMNIKEKIPRKGEKIQKKGIMWEYEKR